MLNDIEKSRKLGFGERLGGFSQKQSISVPNWENHIEFGDFHLDLGRNWERFGELEATKEKCFMRKKGYKGRCEKRVLNKCQDVCRTYDDSRMIATIKK